MATDKFGALALDPVPTIDPRARAAGDVLLYYFGDYLKTCLNAQCGPSWAVLDPFKKVPVVDVSYVDPEEKAFNARDLPALYLYRDTFPATRVGEDMYAQTSRIAVYWVPRPINIERRSDFAPYVNAIAAVINRALIRGRNPAWVVEEDPDTQKNMFGSSLLLLCGMNKPARLIESVRKPVQIEGEGERGSYTGLKVTVQTEELYHEDPDLWYAKPTQMETGIQQLQADGDGTSAYIVQFGNAP